MNPVQIQANAVDSNVVRMWIARRPGATFYLLALALSWGYWLTLLAQGLRVVPGSVVPHVPGLLGPMFAAMAVTAVIGGRKALRDLLGRMVRLGPGWFSKLMLDLSPLALGAAAFVALRLVGKPLASPDAFAHFPGLPEHWPLAAVVAAVIVVNCWRRPKTEPLLRVVPTQN
jgi:hypothetical protein